jgi:hypothetical protein
MVYSDGGAFLSVKNYQIRVRRSSVWHVQDNLLTVTAHHCANSIDIQRLTALEQENGNLTKVKVDKVLHIITINTKKHTYIHEQHTTSLQHLIKITKITKKLPWFHGSHTNQSYDQQCSARLGCTFCRIHA